MRSFEIQVERDGAWRKVSTITYGAASRIDAATQRRDAIMAGLLGMADWQASDQFTGLRMRLAEEVGSWRHREFVAVTGVGR